VCRALDAIRVLGIATQEEITPTEELLDRVVAMLVRMTQRPFAFAFAFAFAA